MKNQVKRLAKFIPLPLISALVPFVTYAQGATDVLSNVSNFLSALLPILVSLGVIYFIWGVVQYVIAGGEDAKKKGRDHIIYGIIGLAVIISVWGLVYILASTFGVNSSKAPDVINSLVTPPASGDRGCFSSFTEDKRFSTLINYITCVIGGSVIPLIFAIAMVMFIWGTVNFFILNAEEEAKRAQGKQFMIWGIIALAVMVSVWGLVGILGNTFNISTTFLPQVKP